MPDLPDAWDEWSRWERGTSNKLVEWFTSLSPSQRESFCPFFTDPFLSTDRILFCWHYQHGGLVHSSFPNEPQVYFENCILSGGWVGADEPDARVNQHPLSPVHDLWVAIATEAACIWQKIGRFDSCDEYAAVGRAPIESIRWFTSLTEEGREQCSPFLGTLETVSDEWAIGYYYDAGHVMYGKLRVTDPRVARWLSETKERLAEIARERERREQLEKLLSRARSIAADINRGHGYIRHSLPTLGERIEFALTTIDRNSEEWIDWYCKATGIVIPRDVARVLQTFEFNPYDLSPRSIVPAEEFIKKKVTLEWNEHAKAAAELDNRIRELRDKAEHAPSADARQRYELLASQLEQERKNLLASGAMAVYT